MHLEHIVKLRNNSQHIVLQHYALVVKVGHDLGVLEYACNLLQSLLRLQCMSISSTIHGNASASHRFHDVSFIVPEIRDDLGQRRKKAAIYNLGR